jgi:hypothetical protein
MRTAYSATGLAVALTGLAFALGGCTQSHGNLEGVPAQKPTKAEIYINVPGHPELSRVCIDHEAFVTTAEEDTVVAVPGWNEWCK